MKLVNWEDNVTQGIERRFSHLFYAVITIPHHINKHFNSI